MLARCYKAHAVYGAVMDVTPLGTDGEGIRLEAINWGDLGAFVQRIGETGAYEVVVLANQLLLTVQQGTWDTLAGIAGAEKVATAPIGTAAANSRRYGHARASVDSMDKQEEGGWWSGFVTCQLCGHVEVSVWPQEANDKALQCAACGAMAGMPNAPETEKGGECQRYED